ncbi:hypothetical protein MHC_03295 [Mycoplasma haemocanis str. Illinois]|uniref:Uncharacterized protein n=1 Tax=Mycoplasma haemocanis (strain Illinois) TaxID=1111676 RepID=H6N797_MYCHN|nr:hypothetical protein [Mycoplasma haemocanis]AEW45519.1 hypothetical protein MHC_03295 [Mycoplasma haemocanis str. Illinois]
MNSLKLGLSLLGGTGIVSTAVAGAYHYGYFSSKTNTIKDRLINEKYQLLKEGDSSHWTESLKKYKEKHPSESSYDEPKIKKLCQDLVGRVNFSKEDYNKAKKYCVVPQTISERLKALEFTLLDTNGSNSTTKWKSLSDEYKNTGENDKKLSDLNKSEVGNGDSNGDKLKSKCKDVSSKTHWEDNYDSLLENTKRWCTEEGFKQLPQSTSQQ